MEVCIRRRAVATFQSLRPLTLLNYRPRPIHRMPCFMPGARRTHATDNGTKLQSKANTEQKPDSFFRTYHVPVLIGCGIGAVAFLFKISQNSFMFTMWPEELRPYLIIAMEAKREGKRELRMTSLYKAYEIAQKLPMEKLSPEPYLKLTDILIAIGDGFEEIGELEGAYWAYGSAVLHLKRRYEPAPFHCNSSKSATSGYTAPCSNPISSTDLRVSSENSPDTNSSSTTAENPEKKPDKYSQSRSESLRLVALGYRLGQLVEAGALSANKPEDFYSIAASAVADILHKRSVEQMAGAGDIKDKVGDERTSSAADESELELPSWVTNTDIGAPVEAYGPYYAQVKWGNAVDLYFDVILFFLDRRDIFTKDICRAAQLFTSLTKLIISQPPSFYVGEERDRAIHCAAMTAAQVKKLTDMIMRDQEELSEISPDGVALCAEVIAVNRFNLGMISEMKGDNDEARQRYVEAAQQAKDIDMLDVSREVQAALRRLQKASIESKEKTP